MSKDRPFIWRSKLEDHKQVGKELQSPFQRMGIATHQVHWWRDLLPEFLWIDSLVQAYGNDLAWNIFGSFLEAADRFNPDANEILDGTVSAFRLIPEDKRQLFREDLSSYLKSGVLEPFWYVLSLYPECPMSWLAPEPLVKNDAAIAEVRHGINRLLPGKDDHTGFCRSFPLHRMFTHNRVVIVDALTDLADAIKSYPRGDKWRVETFARQTHQSLFLQEVEKNPSRLSWSKDFWRTNFRIVPCQHD